MTVSIGFAVLCTRPPKANSATANSNEIANFQVCHPLHLAKELPRTAIPQLLDSLEKLLITMHEEPLYD